MTAQINDRCFHQKIHFEIVDGSGDGFFNPDSLGVQIEPFASCCWRGYVAEYSIIDAELLLTRLDIGLAGRDDLRAQAGEGPELFGAYPTRSHFSAWLYSGFQFPISFTGRLLLSWKFENVREILFEAGRVIEHFDRSPEMAAVRGKFTADCKRANGKYEHSQPRSDIEAWIEKCYLDRI